MRSHNANIVQSLKFRIKKYRQNFYSGKNETKTTPKIKVLKNKKFGKKIAQKALNAP